MNFMFEWQKRYLKSERILYIMHAAYVMSFSTRAISLAFYKRNEKLYTRALLSYISTRDF